VTKIARKLSVLKVDGSKSVTPVRKNSVAYVWSWTSIITRSERTSKPRREKTLDAVPEEPEAAATKETKEKGEDETERQLITVNTIGKNFETPKR
jgi:hypothetical protein